MNQIAPNVENQEANAESDAALLDVKENLADADYGRPQKPCDLIMKGGVTSGIVYPNAICKLARRFFFRNIGGTSAGAIAAALAAAAELNRRGGGQGFNLLAQLPGWLGAGTNLIDLFQPSSTTKPLFRILLGAMGSKRLAVRSTHIFGNLVAAYPVTAVASFLVVLLLAMPIVIPLWGKASGFYAAAVALALSTITALSVLALRFFFALRTDIPNNKYGLCTGSVQTKSVKPLTVWLNERLTEYSGVPGILTFGHLWNAPWPPGQSAPGGNETGVPLLDEDAQRANRSVNLEVVTTNLTVGRPHTLPFGTLESDVYYYAPEELKDFFPPPVMECLAAGSAKVVAAGHLIPQAFRRDNGTTVAVVPLPDGADLPVIVAARMSLSFPLLFSAVPLYGVARSAAGAPGAAVANHWFSDGGLSSNLPMHFFDRPLPRWPTFALNLRAQVPQGDEKRRRRVAMATDFAPDTNDLPQSGGGRITSFLLAIFDTLQNWTDNTQLTMPGYRERVVEVQLAPNQGGLNLNMDADVREALTGLGAEAGVELLKHYGGPPESVPPMWTHHRWIRFFSTMSVAEMWLRHFHPGYSAPVKPDATYSDLATTPPPWCRYQWKGATQSKSVCALAGKLDRLGSDAAAALATDSAANGPPQPGPELRTRPRT